LLTPLNLELDLRAAVLNLCAIAIVRTTKNSHILRVRLSALTQRSLVIEFEKSAGSAALPALTHERAAQAISLDHCASSSGRHPLSGALSRSSWPTRLSHARTEQRFDQQIQPTFDGCREIPARILMRHQIERKLELLPLLSISRELNAVPTRSDRLNPHPVASRK
jgi:hypothetical protein